MLLQKRQCMIIPMYNQSWWRQKRFRNRDGGHSLQGLNIELGMYDIDYNKLEQF